MIMLIRAYLRVSTTEQDAQRAKEELNNLIEDSETGDVLLIENMDRYSFALGRIENTQSPYYGQRFGDCCGCSAYYPCRVQFG